MKKVQKLLLVLSLVGYMLAPVMAQHTLTVQIENIVPESGTVYLALYESAAAYKVSESGLPFKIGSLPAQQLDTDVFQWTDVPAGEYGVALYQDINNSEYIDKSRLGIPKEPYAFSNNPRAKWRKPKFSEIAFTIDEAPPTIVVQLQFWKNM